MNAVPPLRAKTVIPLLSPQAVMTHLREHFGEHGIVSGGEKAWSVAFEIGKASASMRDGAIAFHVEAADDTSLSFLQWSIAEHVCEFATAERPDIVWRGGTAPGAPLPYFREMRVVRAGQVTPAMRRLTLAGTDLARFAHGGLHVRLLLPPRPGVVPVWPVMAADGRQAWPAGEKPAIRVYTIRRIDVEAGELDVDFVLHEGNKMPGARFAVEACAGAIVGMIGPGGGSLKSAPRYLFLGDETALPAISRMLEELPPDAEATAFIEIAEASEIQRLAAKPGIELHWLSRNGHPAGSTTLLADAVRELDGTYWHDDLFVWSGCEYSAARSIRHFLRSEKRIPKERQLVTSYWRRGTAGDEID